MASTARKTTGRIRAPAALHPVPQTREDVIEAIAEIGRAQRERQRIEAAMNDELAAIRERYEVEAAPHGETIKRQSAAVQTWCEAHRGELTRDGKVKTAALASGEVAWRTAPPSVRVTGEAAVLEALRARGLDRFVRTKESVNKEAILNEPKSVADVPGIKVVQCEDFVIRPFETELEEVL